MDLDTRWRVESIYIKYEKPARKILKLPIKENYKLVILEARYSIRKHKKNPISIIQNLNRFFYLRCKKVIKMFF